MADDAHSRRPRLVRMDPADRVVDLRALLMQMERELRMRNAPPVVEEPVVVDREPITRAVPVAQPEVRRTRPASGFVVAALMGAAGGALAMFAVSSRDTATSMRAEAVRDVEGSVAHVVETRASVDAGVQRAPVAVVQSVSAQAEDAGASLGVRGEGASVKSERGAMGSVGAGVGVSGSVGVSGGGSASEAGRAIDGVGANGEEASARGGAGRAEDIDSLLDRAIGQVPVKQAAAPTPEAVARAEVTEAAPAAGDDGLPETPPRAEIARVLGSLLAEIRRCAGEQVGLATATILVRSDGTVGSASIGGDPFGGTGEGACMEEVVRGARFSPFRQTTFRITYPFSIR